MKKRSFASKMKSNTKNESFKITSKKCIHCHKEIDVNANVCPYCNKKQLGCIGSFLLVLAVFLGIMMMIGSCASKVLPSDEQERIIEQTTTSFAVTTTATTITTTKRVVTTARTTTAPAATTTRATTVPITTTAKVTTVPATTTTRATTVPATTIILTEPPTLPPTSPPVVAEPNILHFILNADSMCIHINPNCTAAEQILPENYATVDINENELSNYANVYWACGKCSKRYSAQLPKFQN